MESQYIERRRFKRYQVNGGMIFSDSEALIGPARVVDICEGGVKCISLSLVNCPITWVDGVELYDSSRDTVLFKLRGKMVKCDHTLSNSCPNSKQYCSVFGFMFSPMHYSRLVDFEQFFLAQK